MSHLRLVSASLATGERDEACLDAYQRELSYIHRSFRRLGVPLAEVEDLSQELFLVLRQIWHRYDPSRPLRPFLFAIAFRLASAQKRKRRHEEVSENLTVTDSGPGPEDWLEANQARRLLLEALEQVPLPRRAVLILHEIELIPVVEVATTLSIPLFTVYSRLRKGRRELDRAIRRIVRRSGLP